MNETKCRICGTGLTTSLPHTPQPLLPGDIPALNEVCADCATKCGPLPDTPYTPPWAHTNPTTYP